MGERERTRELQTDRQTYRQKGYVESGWIKMGVSKVGVLSRNLSYHPLSIKQVQMHQSRFFFFQSIFFFSPYLLTQRKTLINRQALLEPAQLDAKKQMEINLRYFNIFDFLSALLVHIIDELPVHVLQDQLTRA